VLAKPALYDHNKEHSMSTRRTQQSTPERRPTRGAAQEEREQQASDAAGASGDSIAQEASLLSKSNDTYHGGVAQRGQIARQIQRRLGNRHAQRVVAEAQREHLAGADLSALPVRGALVQRSITDTLPTSFGEFKINMITKNGAPASHTGLDGSINFMPKVGAPKSNKIAMIQIVKLTDGAGGNVNPQSLPTTHGPSLRTAEDKAAGVEGGFFTDVLHNDFGNTNKDAPAGSALPPQYAGGTPVTGFKRSDDPADIKAAEITDTPGTTSDTGQLNFSFETVARGEDMMQDYGSLKWAFDIKDGKVVSETPATVTDGPSATFDAAMEKHRDFYTHEPVSFYFEFDSRDMASAELFKLGPVVDYMTEHADVRLTLTGRADLRGGVAYNQQLARDRIAAVRQAIVDAGGDASRINTSIATDVVAPTDDQTQDAITPQDNEANRQFNRSVIVTFERTATPAPAGP
jgi:outer membrane protein OmpA-like peptidoglycan-associated protein